MTGPTNAADIRPVVARQFGQAPVWMIAGLMVLGGIVLFGVLDGRRRAATAPTTQAGMVDQIAMPSALPPLYFPPEPPAPPPPPEEFPVPIAPSPPLPASPQFQAAPAPEPTPLPNFPTPAFAPSTSPLPPSPPVQAGGDGPVLVIDTTASRAEGRTEGAATAEDTPVRTTRLRRRATTVPQGTLIPAVLETALDSTRPGHVRAIVSRDIRGFDGSRILIPRGTRLFGEYQSDMAPGQSRALVQWTRLVRPDGVSVVISSPAADMQGRSGVQGRVDSHFLERFAGSLLQSTLNIGGALAVRNVGGDAPVIVASAAGVLPAAPTTGSQGQPTLRVGAGARVAVLVARDLEFPSGESRR